MDPPFRGGGSGCLNVLLSVATELSFSSVSKPCGGLISSLNGTIFESAVPVTSSVEVTSFFADFALRPREPRDFAVGGFSSRVFDAAYNFKRKIRSYFQNKMKMLPLRPVKVMETRHMIYSA